MAKAEYVLFFSLSIQVQPQWMHVCLFVVFVLGLVAVYIYIYMCAINRRNSIDDSQPQAARNCYCCRCWIVIWSIYTHTYMQIYRVFFLCDCNVQRMIIIVQRTFQSLCVCVSLKTRHGWVYEHCICMMISYK